MGSSRDSQTVFQCFDGGLAEISPDVLGLWATVPTSSSQALAFSTNVEPVPHAPLWRVSLPAELHLAQHHLASAEAKLQASQKALATATDRLGVFIEAQRAGVAFGIASADRRTSQPEAALEVLLRAIHEAQAPVSFGLAEHLGGGWEQAAQQFQAILERLRQLVAYYVWVETRVQEGLLGQTTVSWTGDVHTVWREGLSPAEVELHQRALALALQSRDTLLQTLVMVTQFAVRLSLLLSMPGGVILALPAAWKFINQVLAEFARQE
jgi:hypothetical protein